MPPRYNWPCPTCKAPAGERCRSLTTNRVTDTHMARLMARYREAP